MSLWEFAISIKDELEAHRKREGDIISFKPYPWKDWGRKGNKHCLIVLVDGLTEQEAFSLKMPQYNINLNIMPSPKEIEILNLVTISKRRYQLPLNIIKDGWYPDLDITKVQDKKINYQPLLDNEIIIDTKEPVAIFYDKGKKSFKYSVRKII